LTKTLKLDKVNGAWMHIDKFPKEKEDRKRSYLQTEIEHWP